MTSRRTPLSEQTCRARLLTSHRGFLVGSRAERPFFLPVELDGHAGQVLVQVPDEGVRDGLLGQVVALSVGQRAFRLSRGWTVVATGRLGRAEGPALGLDVSSVQGATFAPEAA